MKILLTLLISCLLNSIASATILTVCSNTAYPAQYSTIQSAMNAASAGDTIYIYPGTYNESPSFNKRLNLIGPGIDPRRPNRLPATITSFFYITGSAGSGSVIMGLDLLNGLTSGDQFINVDNVTVTECRFVGGAGSFFGNNILFENCIVTGSSSTGGGIYFSTANAIGNVVQNNYIHGFISVRPATNTIIRNNIFASGDANTNAFTNMISGEEFGINVKIQNNIFFKSNPIGAGGVANNCQFQNNIYYLTNNPIPANGNSSGNINADPKFVNFPIGGAGFSFQYDFHLQPGSPGINYGIDGKDLGMWGGSEPVNAGFEPPVPRIYDLKVMNSTVPVGGTIQLTIKATRAL